MRPVLRHAYVQWREWLVGQTWSNFQDAAVLPDSVDFIGSTDGTVFVRQPQVRYTARRPVAVGREPADDDHALRRRRASIETDDSSIPDLTARYTFKGDWGHFSVAGLARELKYETTGVGAIDASTWSAAASLSGKFNVGKNDIRWMLLGGNLGRYVGLNFANDAVLDAGGDLEAIDGFAGFVAYRHVWSDKWRSNLYYAMEEYDNEVGLTGGGANKSSDSWTVNTWLLADPEARHRRGVPPRGARTRERRRRLARPPAVHDQVLVLSPGAIPPALPGRERCGDRRAPVCRQPLEKRVSPFPAARVTRHSPSSRCSSSSNDCASADSSSALASLPSVPTVSWTRARSVVRKLELLDARREVERRVRDAGSPRSIRADLPHVLAVRALELGRHERHEVGVVAPLRGVLGGGDDGAHLLLGRRGFRAGRDGEARREHGGRHRRLAEAGNGSRRPCASRASSATSTRARS